MSVLFEHLRRHRLYKEENPMACVRQGSKRINEPAILNYVEMKAIIDGIRSPAVRLMMMVAATTAMRRSEIRGLQWQDLDAQLNLLHLRRGVVQKNVTKMKTQGSRKPVPILPELTLALYAWREQSAYRGEADWIFASPFTAGKQPYWGDSAIQDHVQPAARAAGIAKHVGWHTFRHSLATLLNTQGADVKVVQELLRHASSRMTLDVYTQGDHEQKRAALATMSGLFLVAI